MPQDVDQGSGVSQSTIAPQLQLTSEITFWVHFSAGVPSFQLRLLTTEPYTLIGIGFQCCSLFGRRLLPCLPQSPCLVRSTSGLTKFRGGGHHEVFIGLPFTFRIFTNALMKV